MTIRSSTSSSSQKRRHISGTKVNSPGLTLKRINLRLNLDNDWNAIPKRRGAPAFWVLSAARDEPSRQHIVPGTRGGALCTIVV
jgi:hypothetical protein